MDKKSVLLLDGMNNFKRCFVAFPNVNVNGEHVGAYKGFLSTLAKILREIRPHRCIIVFDGANGTKRRKKIYEDYKADRKPMSRKQLNRNHDFNEDIEDSQANQMIMLLDTLSLLPVTVIQEDGVEADDVIAYLTQQYTNKDWNVTIGSTDKDFYHLIDDNVSVYNLIKKRTFNHSIFIKEYNHTPKNWLIRRLFVVDGKDDNIGGIKGIGKKTIEKVLPFLTDTTIQINIDDIKRFIDMQVSSMDDANKLKKHFINIQENFSILERNKQLMDLTLLDFSVNIKLSINSQIKARINTYDVSKLVKMFTGLQMRFEYDTYQWINMSFLKLNQYAKSFNSKCR